MSPARGIFGLGLVLGAGLALLSADSGAGLRKLAADARAQPKSTAPEEEVLVPGPLPALEPAPRLDVEVESQARATASVQGAISELAERLTWRPISEPDWTAAVRALASELGEQELAILRARAGAPELTDEALLAVFELLREAQSLRGELMPPLAAPSFERLRALLDGAEENADFATIAASSLAALGGPAEARALLEKNRHDVPSARSQAAWTALAFAPQAFVAEALAAHGGDADLALLERLEANSGWAFDAVTRLSVCEQLTSVCLDPRNEPALRRRALGVASTWDDRAGMELALEILEEDSLPSELASAAAEWVVRGTEGDLSPVEGMLLEEEDLERATALAAALAARARKTSGWSRAVASRALHRAAESATSANARRSALLALGNLEDPSVLASIAGILRTEEDATVRGAAIVALSKWRDSDEALRLLEKTARNDPSPSVRALAENAAAARARPR